MVHLYLTQDKIGTPTGGGAVTYHEYRALFSMGVETHPLDGARIPFTDPFSTDNEFLRAVGSAPPVKLAQIYAGCFTNTVHYLKGQGAKVAYTAAAHDINESRREFEELGIPFNFPHLTNPELWAKYVGGYKEADLVICPSTLSKKVMESYGCKNVSIIPHGCEIPREVAPLPRRFVLGFLGSAGPDKGVRYLFEAWKKLNLKDGLLLIAGNNIDQTLPLWRKFGGGNVEFMGFVKDVSDFYNRITCYVQPSSSEGFGIEVLESMAYRRPVIVSRGAGAVDVIMNGHVPSGSESMLLNGVRQGWTFTPRDVDALVTLIENLSICKPDILVSFGLEHQKIAEQYTWEKIRMKYVATWKGLVGEWSCIPE